MKRALLLILMTIPLLLNAQGRQPRLEILAMGGVASYSGDLGHQQTKLFSDHLNKLGPAVGLGLRCHLNNMFSIRASFNYAMISGADSLSDDSWRYRRNLSFRSPIYEGAFLVEFSPINWRHIVSGEQINKGSRRNSNLYFFAGMGFFMFNPQAYYNGEWVDLQPLGTEGQGVRPGRGKYSLSASALIFGAGYRARISNRMSLGVEVGWRRTNTDYLDDVSFQYWNNLEIAAVNGELAAALADRTLDANGQPNPVSRRGESGRGNPKNKDYYGFAQITLAVKLGKVGGTPYYGRGSGKFRTRNKCYQF